MAYFEEAVIAISVPSAVDMSNDAAIPGHNRFVTLDANGEAGFSAAEDAAYGVMTTDQPLGGAGRVVISGIVPVIAGDTVAVGGKVGAGANGVALAAAVLKLGTAVTGGDAGDVIAVKLNLPAA